jgi:pyridoxine kinase
MSARCRTRRLKARRGWALDLMARILAISSQVVSGHVGLSAIVPALQAYGHEVLALPTVLLSNHPGRLPANGQRIEAPVLEAIVEMLRVNGRLQAIDAILSGYLPSVDHVRVVQRAIELCSAGATAPVFLCDPVLGDDPKGVYIDVSAAAAIRDDLLPLAELATPNRFELEWLARMRVDDTDTAIEAARQFGGTTIIATSIPDGADCLATVAIRRDGGIQKQSVAKRSHAPHGTGDLLSALLLSRYLAERTVSATMLADIVALIDRIIAASPDEELNLEDVQWRETNNRG